MKSNLLLLIASISIAILGSETLLRLLHQAPKYPITANESLFWKSSRELGWEVSPNSSFTYSNGYFRGRVSTDSAGNRKNSSKGTFNQSYKTIFFIGDSTTASYEVNDDQTVPALVEKKLRKAGYGVNLVNLGVRGYGTDQSIRKAIGYAKLYNPVEVIYMYTDNDIFDNNILRQPFRKFGKGVYLKNTKGDFEEFNYPVPAYSNSYFGAVILDKDHTYQIFEGTLDTKAATQSRTWPQEVQQSLYSGSYTYRLFDSWINGSNPVDRLKAKLSDWPNRPSDPVNIIHDIRGNTYDVFFALADGLADGGFLRKVHKDYYNKQFTFLVSRLRSIPGITKVHLVEFPSTATLELLNDSKKSDNNELFSSLLQAKIVDSYINLNQKMLDSNAELSEFTCINDGHFCLNGNTWIAENIVNEISF